MLSDTLQHADLNAALQPYYSEMCFDTFPVSPCCWKGGGERGGGGLRPGLGVGGRRPMACDQEPLGLDGRKPIVVLLPVNYRTFKFFPLVHA